MYHTVDANAREAELQKQYGVAGEVPPKIRDEMVARYDRLSKELDANSKIIHDSPERLRGWWGAADSGAMAERGIYGYPAGMKTKLTQWQNRPVSQ